ncbi:GRB10-interacting GYF protein 2 isoform X2 [Chiloscyllium punctatum]|uniref:GRB10-interacting GYF protein 2 isoform X2 n=1 Tax=Chiloscyllium punctatum TaxID=137246 RepID=UPI003B63269D
MAAETQTLNFGPEWLRALSSGGSITSPPLSPALPKYKLADYRYGREEMLALYVKDLKIPVDLTDKEFLPILQEEPLPPLALVPFTEEEQRNFSMSVNSTAVLRLMGRGGGTVVGAPRGRSSSRGRGRGRGESGFYQRSFDEGEGGFGRGVREMHRSQSWEERGERRFEKPGRKEPGSSHPKDQHSNLGASNDFLSSSGFLSKSGHHLPAGRPSFEEMGSSTRKHEFTRSESENWRVSRDEQNGDDDDGGWRLAGPRREGDRWQPHSPGWREPTERRRRFDFEYRDKDDERGHRRVRSGSGSVDDEKDSLPEWCLEDAEEEMGTFDSSGAFLSLKKAPKEPIPEEQELDFKQLEDGEERSNSEDSEKEEAKEPDKRTKEKTDEETSKTEENKDVSYTNSSPSPLEPQMSIVASPPKREEKVQEKTDKIEDAQQRSVKEVMDTSAPYQKPLIPSVNSTNTTTTAATTTTTASPSPKITAVANRNIPQDNDDDEGLKHLEQEAEKMVASLQDNALDDERLSTQIQDKRTKAASMPLTHDAAMKWFYKDPQGEIQGPFTNQEMAEWFQAGYFTMSLFVKRGCDEGFQPLGEVIKMWGRVPFAPGPSPPPLLGDLDQERLKRQQELATLNLYQMQQIQCQQLLQAQLMTRQQYAQAIAHHQKATVEAITTQQQQQQQQQLAVILEQFQALKLRSSEQGLMPPATRSMSVPDSASIWELQAATSQPSGWDGGSVWDLPVDAPVQGTTVEQIQQIERGKAAKLEQEKRDAEIRAKREEEERKRQEIRRHQEELLRRQEEERKRKEEEELARRKQEEALQRQRDHEAAVRQQKEEEERQQEEARRHEERQREEEERRQKEEILRKQEEEQRRKDEEAARWVMKEEETRRRMEEDNRLRMEEENRLRLEEEEQKRKDIERHKELQKQESIRQRQQQQEALRRLQQQQQQQQLAQMKLPSSSTWGQQSSSVSSQTQSTLSLAEIQKLEEERERQLREEQRRQQQDLMKILQQQNQQQKLSGWGNIPKPSVTTKSLLEIQQEEFKQMQKQQENKTQTRASAAVKLNLSACHEESSFKNAVTMKREEASTKRIGSERNHHSSLPVSTTSVWGSVNASPANQWGTDISSVWGAPDHKNTNVGFWDEAVKEVGPPARNQLSKSNKNNSNPGKSHGVQNKANKKAEEEEKLMKLFQGVNKSQDGFTLWCEQMLHVLNTANNLDVPTFVSFLKEVDSPYEVHDYVRAYLGDTPETKDFAKQFLDRRAKQKANQQRQPQQQPVRQQQDSAWTVSHTGLQPIYPSNHSRNQQSNFESVQSGKKKKKQKMIRADPSILGFSVNASSERLNMGEIETLDDY